MTTPTPIPNPLSNDWQTQNLEATHARLQPIRNLKDGVIYAQPSGIHFHIVMKDGPSVRFLLVEQTNPNTGIIQSEINIEEPLLLMEPYTQALLLSLVWRPQPQRVYMAGLGGGRIPLLMHHYLPNAVIDCTDIDPDIVKIAKVFFGVPADERIQIAIQDGRNWLEESNTVYDMILLDVFLDNGYSPYRMTTIEFFQLCRSRLAANGVVAINTLSDDKFIAAKAHTLGKVFPKVYSFAEPSGNMILFGSSAELGIEELHERAAKLDAIHAFPFLFREVGLQVREGMGELDDLVQAAQVLTDAEPPAAYFETLPSFNAPFSRVAPDLPCPCGSGLRFADCHGAPKKWRSNKNEIFLSEKLKLKQILTRE